MGSMKQEYSVVEIGGRKYELAMTLSVIDTLQDKYGSLDAAFTKTGNVSDFCAVLCILMNDAVERHNDEGGERWATITPEWLARRITSHSLKEVNAALLRAFDVSLPDTEGDRSPNGEAGR